MPKKIKGSKTRIHLFSYILLLVVVAGGYLYFFPNHLKADYYLQKAQKLDDTAPYGSREAIGYYNQAIESYEYIGDRGSAVNAYIQLGILHYKFGNITQVERSVLRAVEIGGDEIPKTLKAKIYMLLASTAEPARAIEYINDAIDIATNLNQKVLVIKSEFILARIYEYKANFEDAKKTYLKAIEIAENLTPDDGAFNAEEVYANLAELYEGEGSTKNAIIYYEKALSATRSDAVHGVTIANYMKTIGDLYQSIMQPVKACENWNASREEYVFIGQPPPKEILKLSASEICHKIG